MHSMYAFTTSTATATSLVATRKKRVIPVIQKISSESGETPSTMRKPPQTTTATRIQTNQTVTESGLSKAHPLPFPMKENHESEHVRRNANNVNSESTEVLGTRRRHRWWVRTR